MTESKRTNRKQPVNPVLVGTIAWAVPGLGHWILGHRTRAVILFVTISLTFCTGICIGGVRYTVNPEENRLWFVAEVAGLGPPVIALYVATAGRATSDYTVPVWPDSEIALVYAGIAGLLNILAVLDAMGRAATQQQAALKGRSTPGAG